MISIFHPDSTQPAPVRSDPVSQLTLSALWSFTSCCFLFLAWSKIRHLHALGAPVTLLRWAQLSFWLLLLGFHLWNTLHNWRLLHANQSQSR